MSVFRYNTTTYKVKNIRKARDNCNEMPEVFIYNNSERNSIRFAYILLTTSL